MSRTGSLRAADVRAIHELVGECRDLGDDARTWRHHFAAGLGRLVGAGLAISAEMGPCVYGPRRDLGTIVWGWENGFDPTGWMQMLTGFQRDPMYNPLMNAYIARLPRQTGECLARTDLIADRDWYPSAYYGEVHRLLGADATLTCFRLMPGVEDEYNEVFLARTVGERDFTSRQKAVVGEAVAAIGRLVGGKLSRFAEPAPSGLPPRTRQVLRCLLEGDGDKQIAARLAISPLTVNVHTKVIFKHFGVNSRTELLARWIRRHWGIGRWEPQRE